MDPDAWLKDTVKEAIRELDAAGADKLALGPAMSDSRGMDEVTKYRLDQYEKRTDAADARMQRIEDKLSQISERMSGLATRGTVWGALATGGGIAVAVIALFVGILTYLQALPHP